MSGMQDHARSTGSHAALGRLDELARRKLAAERSLLPTALTAGPQHALAFANAALVQLLAGVTPRDARELVALLGEAADLLAALDAALATSTSAYVRVRGAPDLTLIVDPIVDHRGRAIGLALHALDRADPVPVADGGIAIPRTISEESAVVAVNQRLVLAAVRELELAEDARNRARELEALLSNMTEGVTVFAAGTEVVLTNRSGCELLELPSAEADLEDYRRCDLRAPDGAALDFDRDVLAGLLAGDVAERAVVLHHAGGVRHLVYSGAVVRDARGQVALVLALYRDVTALWNLERARERYLAVLSHDLRGPLSVASMTAELMAVQAPHLPALHALASKVVAQLGRADAMIQDLLDTQKLHAGEIVPVQLVACDLVAVARSVVDDLVLVHGDRIQLHGDASVRGTFGENELRRALWNLIANALKYGGAKTPVTVTVADHTDRVRLSVHNEGPPIPPAARDRLFVPFERGPITQKQPRGWGLGLAMVRGCAEAHGGKVLLASDDEVGTTFTIELPRRAGDAPPQR